MLKITGLNELKRKLENLSNKAQALHGTHNVPIGELLTPSFVSKHTRFATVAEMFAAGGFNLENQEEFNAIPDDKLDEFIRSVSSFATWKAMLGAAGKAWAAKKLGL